MGGVAGGGKYYLPETPENSRSECHAWSVLPIYELVRTIAGINYTDGVVTVKPNLHFFLNLRGQVVTPAGVVKFDCRCEVGRQPRTVTVSEEIVVNCVKEDGAEIIVDRR